MASPALFQTVATTPPAYSTPVLLRFAWKQTRKLWPFALGIALLAVAFLAAVNTLESPARDAIATAITFAGGLTGVLVALGGSIVAFSVEREEQTIHLLRTLPRQWLALYLGNLTATFACAVAAIATVFVFAWPVAGSPPALDVQVVLQILSFLAETLAWATLVSLLCPNPILATILACGAISVSNQLAIVATDSQFFGFYPAEFADAMPSSFVLAGSVLLIDAWLVRRWLDGRTRRVGQWQLRPPREVMHEQPATPSTAAAARRQRFLPRVPVSGPTNSGMSGRLLWQTVRDAWPRSAMAIALAGLLAAMFEFMAYQSSRREVVLLQPPIATLLVVAALCGAFTFHGDQRRVRFRYLTAHGCRPGVLWRIRVGAWASCVGSVVLVCIACVVLLAALDAAALGTTFQQLSQQSHQIAGNRLAATAAASELSDVLRYGLLQSILAVATAYAVGQLVSMHIRSGILAVAASLFGAALVFLATRLTVWWQLSPTWHYLPVIFGCLLATRLRTADWLTERSGWRSWTRVGLAAVLPLVLVTVSIPWLRLQQISQADQQVRAVADESLSDVVAAFQQQVRDAEESRPLFAEFHRDLRQSFREEEKTDGHFDDIEVEDRYLHRLDELMLRPGARAPTSADWIHDVRNLLRGGFEHALAAGKLDKALGHVLTLRRIQWQTWYGSSEPSAFDSVLPLGSTSQWLAEWATASGQTSHDILEAIPRLTEIDQDFPRAEKLVIDAYFDVRKVLAGNADDHSIARRGSTVGLAIAAYQLPWEQERAYTALDVLAALTLDYVEGVVQAARRNHLVRLPLRYDGPRSIVRIIDAAGDGFRAPETIRALYDAEQTARSSHLVAYLWRDRLAWNRHLEKWLLAQTQLQATRMRLALIAYHHDHGEYPESVEALKPDYWPAQSDAPDAGPIRYEIIQSIASPSTGQAMDMGGEMGMDGEFGMGMYEGAMGMGEGSWRPSPQRPPDPGPNDEASVDKPDENVEYLLTASSTYSSKTLRLPHSDEYESATPPAVSSSENDPPQTEPQDE